MRNRNYKLQHDITYLTASMFIVIFLWIGTNVYDSYVTSTIDEVLQMQIIPIEGNFDVKTIQSLKSRTVIRPDFGELVASNEALTEESPIQEELPITEPVNITPAVTTTQQPTGVQIEPVPLEDEQ